MWITFEKKLAPVAWKRQFWALFGKKGRSYQQKEKPIKKESTKERNY